MRDETGETNCSVPFSSNTAVMLLGHSHHVITY
jgi:hypothetical protein